MSGLICHFYSIFDGKILLPNGGGRVVRWCWVNFQCRGVLLIWNRVGQGPTTLAVGAGGGCLDTFILLCLFCSLSLSLWETARYRLEYCLKGPLSQKTTNNQLLPNTVDPDQMPYYVASDLGLHCFPMIL